MAPPQQIELDGRNLLSHWRVPSRKPYAGPFELVFVTQFSLSGNGFLLEPDDPNVALAFPRTLIPPSVVPRNTNPSVDSSTY
jgi:hypothetical protein